MKNDKVISSATALGLLMYVGVGCSSTMRLSGTPGTQFSGYYMTGGGSMDVSGTVPAVYTVSGARLASCEFREASLDADLVLVIHRECRYAARGG